jgi:DNA-dependent RNA polymerase
MDSLIYNEKFIFSLKTLLGDPQIFNNLNLQEKKLKSDKIHNFFICEKFKKKYSESNIKYNIKSFDKSFINEKKKIINILKENMELKNLRKGSADLCCKLKNSILEILTKLNNKNGCNIKDDVKCIEKIYKSLKYHEIYYFIITTILTNVRNNENLIEDCYDYEEQLFSVSSVDFFYSFRKNFFYYIIKKIFSTKKDLNIQEHLRLINKTEEEYLSIDDLISFSKQIELICAEVFFKDSIKYKQENKKRYKLFMLSSEMIDHIIVSNHLPEIIEPEGWVESFNTSKKVNDGDSFVDFSKKTLKILDVIQKKKMKVNINAVKVFKELDNIDINDYNKMSLKPFVPKSVISYYKNYIENNKSYLLKKNIYQETLKYKKKTLSDKKYTNDDFLKDIFINLNVSSEDYEKNSEYINHVKKFRILKQQRIIFDYFLVMSEIYEGFPIYFFNKIDYRLRNYPSSYVFARTTGVYKYFLKDYDLIQLDEQGFDSMLKAYYYPDKFLFNKYNLILKNFESCKNFFSDNKINLNLTSNIIYFKTLEIEIDKCINNNMKTDFMIEVDQKSSSSVFLSIILKNKKLAEYSNLISSKSYDIPTYLGDNTENFFKYLNIHNEKLLNYFKNNRNLHKKAFMTFCYNQLSWGRKKDWIEFLDDNLNDKDYNDLELFSLRYEDFLNDLFPDLIKQKDNLNRIIDIVIKNNYDIILKTLDGSVIKWRIFNKKQEVRKVKNPITKNFESFRYKNILRDKNDNMKMMKSFLPNFIHSMDATFLRLVILEMYYKGYIINHVHDCVMINPQYLNILYDVLKKIYLKDFSDNILEICFLNPTLSIVNDDFKDQITEVFKKFIEGKDDFEINSENLKIDNMYPFEK